MEFEAWDKRCCVHEYFFRSTRGFTPVGRFEDETVRLQAVARGNLSRSDAGAVTYSVPAAVLHACGWDDAAIEVLDPRGVREAIMRELDISSTWARMLEYVQHDPGDYDKMDPESIIYNPERPFGRNASLILWFWRRLDELSVGDWVAVWERSRHISKRQQIAANHYVEADKRVRELTARAIDERLRELVSAQSSIRYRYQLVEILAEEHALSRCSELAARAGIAAAELLGGDVTPMHDASLIFGFSPDSYWSNHPAAKDPPLADDAQWYGSKIFHEMKLAHA